MKFAEQLLSVVVRDGEHRESIMGDLREEYARQVRRLGAARATRWHLRQSAGIAMRYGMARLLRRKPPVRWIAIADVRARTDRWWIGLSRDVLYAWRSIRQRPCARGRRGPDAGRGAGRQQHHVQPDGRARAASVPVRGCRSTARRHDHRARRHLRRSRERVGGRFPRMAAAVHDRHATGRCTCGGTRTCLASTSPSRSPVSACRPATSRCWASSPALGREFIDEDAQPGQHRRVVLGHALWHAALRRRPRHRRHDRPVRRRAVSKWSASRRHGFNIPDGAEVWAPLALTETQWQNRRARRLRGVRATGRRRDRRKRARGADRDHRQPAPRSRRYQHQPPGTSAHIHRRHGRPRCADRS